MHEVINGLAFGDETLCTQDGSGVVAVVHACKAPCPRRAVGYTARSLPSSHPNYLVKETEYHLYLNLIDPPQPLFMLPSFTAFMAFMGKHFGKRRVIIHCNQGESRAPSLTLLYLAKRTTHLPNESYQAAAKVFRERFAPAYSP